MGCMGFSSLHLCMPLMKNGFCATEASKSDPKWGLTTNRIWAQTEEKCFLPCRDDTTNGEELSQSQMESMSYMYANGNNDQKACGVSKLQDNNECDAANRFTVVTFMVYDAGKPIDAFLKVLFPVTLTTIIFVCGIYFTTPESAVSQSLVAGGALSGVILQYIAMVSSLPPLVTEFTLAHIYYLICMVNPSNPSPRPCSPSNVSTSLLQITLSNSSSPFWTSQSGYAAEAPGQCCPAARPFSAASMKITRTIPCPLPGFSACYSPPCFH